MTRKQKERLMYANTDKLISVPTDSLIEVIEYTLPDYVAGYLINGDASGLKNEEIAEIDAFIEKEQVCIVSMEEDSHFRHSNDLHSSGSNCSTYIAHKYV